MKKSIRYGKSRRWVVSAALTAVATVGVGATHLASAAMAPAQVATAPAQVATKNSLVRTAAATTKHAIVHASTKSTIVHASPSRAVLGGVTYVSQTWNNCGPASTSEVLAYWGIERTQDQAAAYLRADGGQGMQPYGWPSYARSLGLHALLGVNGTERLVKALIANGFPIIANQVVSTTDPTRHYRPIVGYDDANKTFTVMDPYMGPNYSISYADFNKIWAPLHGRFTVLYPPAKASLLKAVLRSAGWDRLATVKVDLARVKKRIAHPPKTGTLGMQDGSGSSARSGRSMYLYLAWDDAQLGLNVAAKAALTKAVGQNASPVLVAWVRGELGVAQDV